MQGFKRKIISKLILTMDLGKRINMERTLKLVEDEKFKQKHYDLFKEKFYNESYFNYSKEKESKLKEASKLRKTTREKVLKKRKRTMSAFSYTDTNNIINREVESILCTDPLLKIQDNTENKRESRRLLKSLTDLKDIQLNLSDVLNTQKIHIDNIEENVDSSLIESQNALKELKVADRSYSSIKPMILGGIIGAISMSPIGIMTGMKIGTICSGVGSLIGGYMGSHT